MRYLILAALLSAPCFATFTQVQQYSSFTATGSGAGTFSCDGATPETCTITINATGAGNLLILQTFEFNTTLSSVSGGGVWSIPAGGVLRPSNNQVATAYNLSATAGTTSVSYVAAASGNQRGWVFYEYSTTIGNTFALDSAGAVSNASSATPAGVTLTLTGTNDLITQIFYDGGSNYTSVSGSYTGGGLTSCSGCGRFFAYSANTASGTAPTMTISAASATLVSAVAIKEVTVSANCTPGVQTAAGYSLVTAVCGVFMDSFTSSPPTGNEGNWYDIYYLAADGLNANNKKPIELWPHGGGFLITASSTASPTWQRYYSQRVTDGRIVIVPSYTVNTLYTLAAALNNGDTTATINYTTFANAGCGNSAYQVAGQTGVTFNVGTDVVTVTGAMPACDNANHVVNVTRTNPTSTQASGTPMYIPGINWPSMGNDMAGLLAFLAHCAPGGSSYNAGTCAGKTNIAGDPHRISMFGVSAGAQLITMLVEMGNCQTGPTCTLINTTPGTPGYHPWSDTGWAIYNPGWMVPMVGASISDLTGRTYPLSSTYVNHDTMMTGVGSPICTAGYSAVTLTCTTPTAAYTASLAQDVLTQTQGGTKFGSLLLDQAGASDVDFYTFETLLGAQSGFIYHSYAGQNHALDYLSGHTPATSTAFKEAQAAFGVNLCAAGSNLSSCPAANPIGGTAVF